MSIIFKSILCFLNCFKTPFGVNSLYGQRGWVLLIIYLSTLIVSILIGYTKCFGIVGSLVGQHVAQSESNNFIQSIPLRTNVTNHNNIRLLMIFTKLLILPWWTLIQNCVCRLLSYLKRWTRGAWFDIISLSSISIRIISFCSDGLKRIISEGISYVEFVLYCNNSPPPWLKGGAFFLFKEIFIMFLNLLFSRIRELLINIIMLFVVLIISCLVIGWIIMIVWECYLIIIIIVVVIIVIITILLVDWTKVNNYILSIAVRNEFLLLVHSYITFSFMRLPFSLFNAIIFIVNMAIKVYSRIYKSYIIIRICLCLDFYLKKLLLKLYFNKLIIRPLIRLQSKLMGNRFGMLFYLMFVLSWDSQDYYPIFSVIKSSLIFNSLSTSSLLGLLSWVRDMYIGILANRFFWVRLIFVLNSCHYEGYNLISASMMAILVSNLYGEYPPVKGRNSLKLTRDEYHLLGEALHQCLEEVIIRVFKDLLFSHIESLNSFKSNIVEYRAIDYGAAAKKQGIKLEKYLRMRSLNSYKYKDLIRVPEFMHSKYHYIPINRTILSTLVEYNLSNVIKESEIMSTAMSQYLFISLALVVDTIIRVDCDRMLNILLDHSILPIREAYSDPIELSKFIIDFLGTFSFRSMLKGQDFYKFVFKFSNLLQLKNKTIESFSESEMTKLISYLATMKFEMNNLIAGTDYRDIDEKIALIRESAVDVDFSPYDDGERNEKFNLGYDRYYRRGLRRLDLNMDSFLFNVKYLTSMDSILLGKLRRLYVSDLRMYIDLLNLDTRGIKSVQWKDIMFKSGINLREDNPNIKTNFNDLINTGKLKLDFIVSDVSKPKYELGLKDRYGVTMSSNQCIIKGTWEVGNFIASKWLNVFRDYLLLSIMQNNQREYNRLDRFKLLVDSRGRMYYQGMISPSYSSLVRPFIKMQSEDFVEYVPHDVYEDEWDVSASMWTIILGIAGEWDLVKMMLDGQIDFHEICRRVIIDELPNDHPWKNRLTREAYKKLASPVVYGSDLRNFGFVHLRQMFEEHCLELPVLSYKEVKIFAECVHSGLDKLVNLNSIKKLLLEHLTKVIEVDGKKKYMFMWRNSLFDIGLGYHEHQALYLGVLANFAHSIDANVMWKVWEELDPKYRAKLNYSIHDAFSFSAVNEDEFLFDISFEIKELYYKLLKESIENITSPLKDSNSTPVIPIIRESIKSSSLVDSHLIKKYNLSLTMSRDRKSNKYDVVPFNPKEFKMMYDSMVESILERAMRVENVKGGIYYLTKEFEHISDLFGDTLEAMDSSNVRDRVIAELDSIKNARLTDAELKSSPGKMPLSPSQRKVQEVRLGLYDLFSSKTNTVSPRELFDYEWLQSEVLKRELKVYPNSSSSTDINIDRASNSAYNDMHEYMEILFNKFMVEIMSKRYEGQPVSSGQWNKLVSEKWNYRNVQMTVSELNKLLDQFIKSELNNLIIQSNIRCNYISSKSTSIESSPAEIYKKFSYELLPYKSIVDSRGLHPRNVPHGILRLNHNPDNLPSLPFQLQSPLMVLPKDHVSLRFQELKYWESKLHNYNWTNDHLRIFDKYFKGHNSSINIFWLEFLKDYMLRDIINNNFPCNISSVSDSDWVLYKYIYDIYNVSSGIIGLGLKDGYMNIILDVRRTNQSDINWIMNNSGVKPNSLTELYYINKGGWFCPIYLKDVKKSSSASTKKSVYIISLKDLTSAIASKLELGRITSWSDSEKIATDPNYKHIMMARVNLNPDYNVDYSTQKLHPYFPLQLWKLSKYFDLPSSLPLPPSNIPTESSELRYSNDSKTQSSSELKSYGLVPVVTKDNAVVSISRKPPYDIEGKLLELKEERQLLELKEERQLVSVGDSPSIKLDLLPKSIKPQTDVNEERVAEGLAKVSKNYDSEDHNSMVSQNMGYSSTYVVKPTHIKTVKSNVNKEFILGTADIETGIEYNEEGLRINRPILLSYYNEYLTKSDIIKILAELNLTSPIDYELIPLKGNSDFKRTRSLIKQKGLITRWGNSSLMRVSESSNPPVSWDVNLIPEFCCIVFKGPLCIINWLKYLIAEKSYLPSSASRIIYYHNGTKFDFGYIIEGISLYQKFYSSSIPFEESKLKYNVLMRDSSIYNIILPSLNIELRDSYKLLNSSLKKLIESILKEPEFGSTHKGILKEFIGMTNSEILLSPNYPSFIKYCGLDSIKLYEILLVFNSILISKGINITIANTISSLSFKSWKVFLDQDSLKKHIALSNKDIEKVFHEKGSEKLAELRQDWMEAPSKDVDSILRESFKGGIVDFSKRILLSKDIFSNYIDLFSSSVISEIMFDRARESILGLDIVSSYPTSLSNKDYPLGPSYPTLTYKDGKLGVYKVIVTMPSSISSSSSRSFTRLYHKSRLGLIPLRPTLSNSSYSDVLTSVEIEYARQHGYKIEIISGIYYDNSSSSLFTDYIKMWFSEKQKASLEKNKPLKTTSKLFLNGLYGIFGINPENEILILIRDNEYFYYLKFLEVLEAKINSSRKQHINLGGFQGSMPTVLDSQVNEKLILIDRYTYSLLVSYFIDIGLHKIDSKTKKPISSKDKIIILNKMALQSESIGNVLVSSLTTAYSRILLLDVINNSNIDFIYSDTDSAYFKVPYGYDLISSTSHELDYSKITSLTSIKIGENLGEWGNVLDSDYSEILGMVVLSPKQYSLLVYDHRTSMYFTITKNRGSTKIDYKFSSLEEFYSEFNKHLWGISQILNNPSISYNIEPSFIGFLLYQLYYGKVGLSTLEENKLKKYGLLKETYVREWSVKEISSTREFTSFNNSSLFTIESLLPTKSQELTFEKYLEKISEIHQQLLLKNLKTVLAQRG